MYIPGSKFVNEGFEWHVLSRNGQHFLLFSPNKMLSPYVVAWKLYDDGSWCQGRYFENFQDASKFFVGLVV